MVQSLPFASTQIVTLDHSALFAACGPDVGLCTIVGIEGSYSRRVGAQLAVSDRGQITGSLSDGCLEQQLASDLSAATKPVILRYGSGSGLIDFRLPCGGGLDILLDPAPDRFECQKASDALTQRREATLLLPDNPLLLSRSYIPKLVVRAFGEGPELVAFSEIGHAAQVVVEVYEKSELRLGVPPQAPPPDRWTASVLLFHDHEWEVAILKHALAGPGFYIGAQGGQNARLQRTSRLLAEGFGEEAIARIRSPIGSVMACREPRALALSALTQIVTEYERLHPHR